MEDRWSSHVVPDEKKPGKEHERHIIAMKVEAGYLCAICLGPSASCLS
jgi:hypothetical protein